MQVAIRTSNLSLQQDGELQMGIAELLKGQERLAEKFKDMDEKVDRLEEAVWGNGKPGINQRLALIEEHLNRIDRWCELFIKVATPIIIGIMLLGITAFVESVR